MTQPENNLAAAVAELQTKLPTVEKHQTATVRSDKGNYSYDYADLSDVSDAVLPLLGAIGLSWICRPTFNADGKFVLAYELLHVSGESRTGEYPLATTGTPQTIGGHITYARRYALCAVTGVAPKGDDDDAAEASSGRPKPAQRAARPRQQAPAAEPSGPPAQTAQRVARPSPPPLPGDPDDGPKMISGPQRGKVLALFDDAGVTERDERLDISRRVVGRSDVTSANDLTSQEASKLIDWLQESVAGDGFTAALTELFATSEGGDGGGG